MSKKDKVNKKIVGALMIISEETDAPMETLIDYFSILPEMLRLKHSVSASFEELANAFEKNIIVSDVTDQVVFNREQVKR